MNNPSVENDALRERIVEAILNHVDHMEGYTLPAPQPGFIDGWSHALRLLRRDADFIAHSVLPPGETDN